MLFCVHGVWSEELSFCKGLEKTEGKKEERRKQNSTLSLNFYVKNSTAACKTHTDGYVQEQEL